MVHRLCWNQSVALFSALVASLVYYLAVCQWPYVPIREAMWCISHIASQIQFGQQHRPDEPEVIDEEVKDAGPDIDPQDEDKKSNSRFPMICLEKPCSAKCCCISICVLGTLLFIAVRNWMLGTDTYSMNWRTRLSNFTAPGPVASGGRLSIFQQRFSYVVLYHEIWIFILIQIICAVGFCNIIKRNSDKLLPFFSS